MIDPHAVEYRGWELKEVIYNNGDWSLARGQFREENAVGIRWNHGGAQDKGFPLSRSKPVWFILPDELAEILCAVAKQLPK